MLISVVNRPSQNLLLPDLKENGLKIKQNPILVQEKMRI
jgi:hypothetical protein